MFQQTHGPELSAFTLVAYSTDLFATSTSNGFFAPHSHLNTLRTMAQLNLKSKEVRCRRAKAGILLDILLSRPYGSFPRTIHHSATPGVSDLGITLDSPNINAPCLMKLEDVDGRCYITDVDSKESRFTSASPHPFRISRNSHVYARSSLSSLDFHALLSFAPFVVICSYPYGEILPREWIWIQMKSMNGSCSASLRSFVVETPKGSPRSRKRPVKVCGMLAKCSQVARPRVLHGFIHNGSQAHGNCSCYRMRPNYTDNEAVLFFTLRPKKLFSAYLMDCRPCDICRPSTNFPDMTTLIIPVSLSSIHANIESPRRHRSLGGDFSA